MKSERLGLGSTAQIRFSPGMGPLRPGGPKRTEGLLPSTLKSGFRPGLESQLTESQLRAHLGHQVQAAVQNVSRSMQSLRAPLGIRRELERALDARDVDGILGALRRMPAVAELLDKPSGSRSFGTIEAHTRTVLNNLLEQLPFHDVESMDDTDPRPLVRHLLLATALHDIGKGHSVEQYAHTKHQHEFTGPIVDRILGGLGYAPDVKAFVKAIIDHDHVGDAGRGLESIEEAVQGLVDMAEQARLPLDRFMKLADLFYISDASAYPRVRKEAFREEASGKLTCTRQLYRDLHAAVRSEAAKVRSTRPFPERASIRNSGD